MKTFETNDGKYIVRIGGSGSTFTDPNHGQPESTQLDLLPNYRNGLGNPSNVGTVCTNVQLPDLIAALNEIEGVEATYTPPKPLLSEIPEGTAFHFGHGSLYIKLAGNRLYSQRMDWITNITPGDLNREVIIITEGEDL